MRNAASFSVIVLIMFISDESLPANVRAEPRVVATRYHGQGRDGSSAVLGVVSLSSVYFGVFGSSAEISRMASV